jgi:hypothetical protein
MQPKGIPDTLDEARQIVAETADFDQHTSSPAHWPHSQIISLAHIVHSFDARLEALEAKPKRGRPPKSATGDDDGTTAPVEPES